MVTSMTEDVGVDRFFSSAFEVDFLSEYDMGLMEAERYFLNIRSLSCAAAA